MTLKEIHLLAPLFHIWGIKDLMSHLQKLLHASCTALVLVTKMIAKKVLYMTDTQLNRDSREDPADCSPKTQIPIHDKALQGIMDSVSKGDKDRLPTLSVLTSRKLGHGNILAMDIGGEKKGILFALDEDGLPIRQKVTSPSGLQFLGYLLKAFTVSTQLINPPKGYQRGDFQLSPHTPIRRFLSEIEPCCLVMHGFSKLMSFVKSLSASQTLVPLNFQPLAIVSSSLSCSMLFNLRPCAIGTLFFLDISLSSLSHSYTMKRRSNKI